MGCGASSPVEGQQRKPGVNRGQYGWKFNRTLTCRYSIINDGEPAINSLGGPYHMKDFKNRVRSVYRLEKLAKKNSDSVENILRNAPAHVSINDYSGLTIEWYNWFRSKVPLNENQDLSAMDNIPSQEPLNDASGIPYADDYFFHRQAQIIDVFWASVYGERSIESIIAEMQHLKGAVSLEYLAWYQNHNVRTKA